jgi:glycosyltransferase involved in cell wall biosynthesis
VRPQKVFYLPNGVSARKYAGWSGPVPEEAARCWRQQLGLADSFVLLTYTRFAEFRPERLFKIVQKILQMLPENETTPIKLLVVGGGFFGEEKTLKERAAPFGLAERIVTTGQAAWEDLPGLLRCGDVALYPFDDNLINRARCSVKFMELLIAERPVVTEAVGQQREYLRQGEGGFLVEPGDEEGFARAAIRLIQLAPETRRELGQNGAKRLWSEFGWERLVLEAEKAYRLVLQS